MKEAASIGIIGGADGPTAVFVTGSPIGVIAALVAAVVIVGGAAAWYLHHKNKQD